MLDGAPDALVLIDAEGQIRFVNAQAERLFGYPRDELLGQTIELLVPERFRASHVGSRNRFMRAATLRPMGSGLELYGRRKDGREFPVEISLSPLETEQGLFITSSIRDVSERKQAELATNLLAAIVDSSEDAIISASLDWRDHQLEPRGGAYLRLCLRRGRRTVAHHLANRTGKAVAVRSFSARMPR